MQKKKRPHKKGGKTFWEKEYKSGEHLTLSTSPSEDLVKFSRWLVRHEGLLHLNKTGSVLDLGCGNGRNLIYLAKEFGIRGVGYDISSEAIGQAARGSRGLPIEYHVRALEEPLPLSDNSQALVLDMMTSHVLSGEARARLTKEIVRVLKPGGWLFWKTFFLDGDLHAKRLLRDHPAEESGSYIHPEIGVAEHVFTEREIHEALEGPFVIHKILRSHLHMLRGRAFKRRSVSIYAQKEI